VQAAPAPTLALLSGRRLRQIWETVAAHAARLKEASAAPAPVAAGGRLGSSAGVTAAALLSLQGLSALQHVARSCCLRGRQVK
jgi:hypothetical protein